MKKIFAIMLVAVMTLSAHAQFEKGTHYLNASLSGFNIGYDKSDFAFGISGEYGYYVANNWMIGGVLGYKYHGSNYFQLKPEFRYSFANNGLNLGAGLQYEYAGTSYVQLCPQVGYTFFLNNKISLEPAIYADFCLNDFSNGSSFGLKIGIGLYR